MRINLSPLDLDDFKRVNDEHGHPRGDEVLRRVARALDSESRWADEPARYGGEEFAVALPETDLAGAIEVAERIRERVETEEVPLGGSGEVILTTASIGVASLPGSAADVEMLVAAADAALYEAKRNGKNRVVAAPAAAAERPRGAPRRPGGDDRRRIVGQRGPCKAGTDAARALPGAWYWR
jgi:diguanylate cyclase (GGDEF)-like protein